MIFETGHDERTSAQQSNGDNNRPGNNAGTEGDDAATRRSSEMERFEAAFFVVYEDCFIKRFSHMIQAGSS